LADGSAGSAADLSREPACGGTNRLFGGSFQIRNPLGMGQEQVAFFGKRDSRAGAAEEGDPKVFFQQLYVL